MSLTLGISSPLSNVIAFIIFFSFLIVFSWIVTLLIHDIIDTTDSPLIIKLKFRKENLSQTLPIFLIFIDKKNLPEEFKVMRIEILKLSAHWPSFKYAVTQTFESPMFRIAFDKLKVILSKKEHRELFYKNWDIIQKGEGYNQSRSSLAVMESELIDPIFGAFEDFLKAIQTFHDTEEDYADDYLYRLLKQDFNKIESIGNLHPASKPATYEAPAMEQEVNK